MVRPRRRRRVQAVATQTLRNAPSLEEAGRALDARLVALAQAHDVLVQGAWSSASLSGLVAGAVALHGDGVPGRFTVSGPDLTLAAGHGLTLARAEPRPRRRRDRRTADLLPAEAEARIRLRLVDRPGDRHPAGAGRERAVLGGVGGELVQHQRQGQAVACGERQVGTAHREAVGPRRRRGGAARR
ncbi:HWE histidine kinase domain-containing protein, partial [Methylobacterium sp. J-077]|uniref:HWE histidine kinase domain-containing protein n=1 Tax=Methylobacterium sp. J-077 TaxID=2836656 RepID=UPI0024453037